jgi:hypothetical protein
LLPVARVELLVTYDQVLLPQGPRGVERRRAAQSGPAIEALGRPDDRPVGGAPLPGDQSVADLVDADCVGVLLEP